MIAKKAIFFDLDGTLLPMDEEEFFKSYIFLFARDLSQYDYEPVKFMKSVYRAYEAMERNDGLKTNEMVFYEILAKIYGEKKVRRDRKYFNDFYRETFPEIDINAGYQKEAAWLVQRVKKEGYRTILAADPLYAKETIIHRLHLAGLLETDFEYISTFSNSTYCKPNPNFYREMLSILNLEPKDVFMIGNHIEHDGSAKRAGIETFILMDNGIVDSLAELQNFTHGSWWELNQLIFYT